jgi:(p)ppGpp synthase/HD superfamily hydrolase
MKDLRHSAREFAMRKHAGQKRKYTGKPYVTHLDTVVGILAAHNFNSPFIHAVAYLHDVLEDTDTTLPELQMEFGFEISEMVYWLSDLEKGPRDTRKMMSTIRLSRAPFNAKLVKLADIIDNCGSVIEYDPTFAPVYVAEKQAILMKMAEVEGDRLSQLALYRESVAAANSLTLNSA